MKLLSSPISLAILSVVLIFASFRVGKRFGSTISVLDTDTVYVDRQITHRDTVHIIQPKEVKVFRTVTDTRVDTVRVPVEFTPVGLVGKNPVTRTGRNFTLTTFNPKSLSYQQQTYTIPPRKWETGLFAVSAVGRLESRISVALRVRYQKVEISPFIGVSASLGANPQLDYGASMSYKLF